METVTRVQTQDAAVCMSDSANTLGKVMHRTILLPAKDK